MSDPTFETITVRSPGAPKRSAPMTVTSRSFRDGAMIANDFVFTGCGGRNQSPQLSWSDVPAGTKSFAITCFDPDAPTGSGYWHWLAFDIPASVTSVEAGSGTEQAPGGGKSGYTDFGLSAYCGPCPPPGDGAHRYIFTVYALDVESLDGASAKTTGASVIFAMRGHVLAIGTIMGRFGH